MTPSRAHSAVWIVILVTAAPAFGQPRELSPEAAYESAEWGALPCELPVTLAGTQILVDGVFVNAKGPFRFLLDTGGMGGGRVDTSLAEKLGLAQVGSVEGGDGTGRATVTMPIYQLDELRVGPATFHGVRVLSRDYNEHGAAVRGHIDGVLGFHLFRELLLTLDYPARAIRLDRGAIPAANGKDIVELTDDVMPTVKIELAGQSLTAHIDSGAMGGISVGTDLAGKLPTIGEPRKVGEGRTISGSFPIQAVDLDGDFVVGSQRISKPEITIAPPLRTANLGGRILESFVLTFDQKNRRARFEQPAQRDRDGAPKRSMLGQTPLEIPMRIERVRPVIDVTINGKGPFPLVLDTGSGSMVFARSLANELGLSPTGKTRIGDPAAPQAIEADQYVLDEITVGDARFESLAAVSWESDILESALGSPRGIIGLAAFADCLLTIDYPRERIVLGRGALSAGDGSVRYRRDGWIPELDLKIGDLVLKAHLDSGNMGALSLPASSEGKLSFKSPPRVIGRGRSVGGDFEIRGGTLAGDVEFAGRRISQPDVAFNDRFAWANIGADVLSRFAITFDQVNERVRFATADEAPREAAQAAPAPNGPRKRYGFMLALGGPSELEIRGTMPGSIAEKAGLLEGDIILRINGESIADVPPEKRDQALRSSPLKLGVRRGDQEIEVSLSWDD